MTTYAGLYGPEALIDSSGRAITSAVIDVFTHGTTTHVSLYQDNARGTPLSNPVPNGVDGSTAGRGLDSYGNLSFYVDPGRYDLRIATGAGTRIVEIEVETDPAESAASLPSQTGKAGSSLVTDGSAAAWRPVETTGLFVPADFGSRWLAKRAAAGSAKAVVACVGDSITQGFQSSNLGTKSWVALLRAALQSAYGDGGSGYSGAMWSSVFTTQSSGSVGGYTAQLWSPGGSWSLNGLSTQTDGPGAASIFASGPGASQAISGVRGTSVRIYYADFPVGVSAALTLTVNIDGSNVGTITLPQVSNRILSTAFTVAAGTHTVTLTTAGSGAFVLFGVSGENATGVVVNNFGSNAQVSAAFIGGSGSTYGNPKDWSGGQNYPCDLLIYSLGVNDVRNNLDPDTYIHQVRTFLEAVKDYGAGATGSPDIVILTPHIGQWEGASKHWPLYLARLRALAESYGAAMVNLWPIGRNSYNYWSSLNYWGSGMSTPGVAGSDLIHPIDVAHQLMYDTLARVPNIVS